LLYRARRGELICVAPDDVWKDEATSRTFVLFALQGEPWTFLGFAVDQSEGRVLEEGVLQLVPVGDELQATNRGAYAQPRDLEEEI
jgi:hypothetical protein